MYKNKANEKLVQARAISQEAFDIVSEPTKLKSCKNWGLKWGTGAWDV